MGLHPSDCYQHLLKDPTPDDVDLETIYPDGDGFIPIDQLGSLLLLASTYDHNPELIANILDSISTQQRLKMHKRLVDAYIDEANLNVIDAIILLGLIMQNHIATNDIPPFTNPQDPASSEFLEYLQVLLTPIVTTQFFNFIREWQLQQQLVPQRIYDH